MNDLPDGEKWTFLDTLRGIFMACFMLALIIAGLTLLNVLFDLNLAFGVGSPTPLPDDWEGLVAMIGIALLFGGIAWVIGIIGRVIRQKKRRRVQ